MEAKCWMVVAPMLGGSVKQRRKGPRWTRMHTRLRRSIQRKANHASRCVKWQQRGASRTDAKSWMAAARKLGSNVEQRWQRQRQRGQTRVRCHVRKHLPLDRLRTQLLFRSPQQNLLSYEILDLCLWRDKAK